MMHNSVWAAFAAFLSFSTHAAAYSIDFNNIPRESSLVPSLARRQSTAGSPSTDPFYAVPANVSDYQPGDIISSRTTPYNLTQIKNYTASYQLLYRTTDSIGNATAAVTTVIIPVNADTEKLLSYQIFYDTPDVDCSPSWALQLGNSIDTGFQPGLDRGWIVSTPDYEGPQAAFTAGVISGQATLDSIRAVLHSWFITGVCPWARVAMWGYSGGALASEWAAELQPSYAPDLSTSIVGAALGGLTPNVTSVALAVNNKTDAGLIPAGILGLSAAYSNLSDYVQEKLVPSKKDLFNSVKTKCLISEVIDFHDTDFLSYFVDGVADLTSPLATSVINAGGVMGLHGTPIIPLYVYKSVFDEVSPVADTDNLINKYCASPTTRIQYIRANYGDHGSEGGYGQPGALAYLDSVLSGTPQAPGCNITTVNM